jgi:glutathione S-transferase
MTLHLITIGPSHYCEKARWALELARLSYREEAHAPIFHMPSVKRAGGRRTAPTLVTPQGVFDDSTDILRYIQNNESSAWRPYSEDTALDAEALALEERFDEVLGPHVRRLAYWYLLPHKKLVCDVVGAPSLPGVERTIITTFYPLVVMIFRRSLNITDAGAERSRARIDEIFAEVGALLADGREFLVGGRLTAADITFAALAAPLLLPAGYAWPLPTLESAPGALRAEIERLRATPAGQYAMRRYATSRAVA